MWEMVRDETKGVYGPSPEVLPYQGAWVSSCGQGGALGKNLKHWKELGTICEAFYVLCDPEVKFATQELCFWDLVNNCPFGS